METNFNCGDMTLQIGMQLVFILAPSFTKEFLLSSTNLYKGVTMIWTIAAEDDFVDMMETTTLHGLLKLGVSNKTVLSDIAAKLSRQMGQRFTFEHIMLKLNELHGRFTLWQWVKSRSGVNWNSNGVMLEATDDVWASIIEEKPMAVVYKFGYEKNWMALMFIFAGTLGGIDDVDCCDLEEHGAKNREEIGVGLEDMLPFEDCDVAEHVVAESPKQPLIGPIELVKIDDSISANGTSEYSGYSTTSSPYPTNRNMK